jgi:FkbH-like protein
MSESLVRLKNKKLSFTSLLQTMGEVEQQSSAATVLQFGISANITTNLLSAALRRSALLNGLRANITEGAYDSHIENVRGFAQSKISHLIIIGFFDNLLPSLEAQLFRLEPSVIVDLQSKIRHELRLVLHEARDIPNVYLSTFHSFHPPEGFANHPELSAIIAQFNGILLEEIGQFKNCHLLDSTAVLSRLGWHESLNSRFYFQFKAPYTLAFCIELTESIFLLSRGAGSYFYKALVLDCDNTLWGGIVGEDLLAGIKLNPSEYPGNVYWYVQNEILSLKKAGILLCLCSKNNAADVDEILESHPHCVIKSQDLIVKKVNWEDKVTNLRAIAKKLNIGLDSLVFLDDSEFECAAVRSQLPTVKVIRVPANVFEYVGLIQEVKALFTSEGLGTPSSDKTKQYQLLELAQQEQQKFGNQDEYLRSLDLKVTLSRNLAAQLPRISELTQKSNQFNLTTRRYSPAEIEKIMSSADRAVYSAHVFDKFGDHGLTGVAIVRREGKRLLIENFLMSCRVIGRGIETAIWKNIFADAQNAGCDFVAAEFIRSSKNSMVENFYSQLGLIEIESSENCKVYGIEIGALNFNSTNHVKVDYVF